MPPDLRDKDDDVGVVRGWPQEDIKRRRSKGASKEERERERRVRRQALTSSTPRLNRSPRRLLQLQRHVMRPRQHRIPRPQRRTRAHDDAIAQTAQRLLAVALLHYSSVEVASVDDHVRVELLEDGHLKLWVPLVQAVGEGVGLEDDVAKVCEENEGLDIVGSRPLFVKEVAEDGCGHALVLRPAEDGPRLLCAQRFGDFVHDGTIVLQNCPRLCRHDAGVDGHDNVSVEHSAGRAEEEFEVVGRAAAAQVRVPLLHGHGEDGVVALRVHCAPLCRFEHVALWRTCPPQIVPIHVQQNVLNGLGQCVGAAASSAAPAALFPTALLRAKCLPGLLPSHLLTLWRLEHALKLQSASHRHIPLSRVPQQHRRVREERQQKYSRCRFSVRHSR